MLRRIGLVLLLLILVAVGGIAWKVAGLPPVRFVLRYGLDPWCAPTGRTLTVEGHELVEIGPGVFRMGSTFGAGGDALGRACALFGLPWGDQPKATDEMPVHFVEFRGGFWIARHEVSNALYERYDAEHRRSVHARGDDQPVVDVSWDDARGYCAWLQGRTGVAVRLPGEAEWECACRGGSAREYCFGDDAALLSAYGWSLLSSRGGVQAVGRLRPNAFGLFDLHGNVWEWCEDSYHASHRGAPEDGSAWKEGGAPFRVCRGGSWLLPAGRCRSAHRHARDRSDRGMSLGFRPAASLSPGR